MKHPEDLVGAIFLGIAIILEWRRGYFADFSPERLKFAIKPIPGLICAAGFFLMLWLDPVIRDFVKSLDSGWVDAYIRIGAFLGYHLTIIIILSSLYFVTLGLHWKRLHPIFFGAIVSSALTALASTILKIIFMRARPYADFGPYSFFNIDGLIQLKKQFQSFPSGDVAIISGAVSYLFLIWKHPARYFLFLIPLATMMARVDANAHWPSDTYFSVCLSLVIASMVSVYSTGNLKKPFP